MDKPHIKAWYGVEDLLHLQVKVNGKKYAVAGSQSSGVQLALTLVDAILKNELGFNFTDLQNAAYNVTIVEDNTVHGFETETGSD